MSMEPKAIAYAEDSPFSCGRDSATALVSIAISIKRIADIIEGNPQQLGLVSALNEAIYQGIVTAKAMG